MRSFEYFFAGGKIQRICNTLLRDFHEFED
jgi:hypothetical protein